MRGIPVALAALLVAGLAAVPPSGAVDLGGTIVNVAPVIFSISLSGLSSGTLTPSSGTTATVTATVVATDTNGFQDLVAGTGCSGAGITVGIIKPDGTTVHLAQAAATFSSGSALAATYTKALAMNFYDAAALTTSTYKVRAVATDCAGSTGVNLLTMAEFNYAQLVAVNAPASLSFGSSLTPGVASGIQSLSLQNYGNVQMDARVSGSAMALDANNTIPLSAIDYGLDSGLSDGVDLTGSLATLTGFDLGSGASSTRSLYLQVTPPTGLAPGVYAGTLTVAAIAG
jgi:hypothetical protein